MRQKEVGQVTPTTTILRSVTLDPNDEQCRRNITWPWTAHQPYQMSSELSRSLKDGQPGPSEEAHYQPSDWIVNVCKSCAPVLCRYSETFKGLKRQGSERKKWKKINPHPKKSSFSHYRDLTKQNEWLRSNIFDAMGNYLFCCKCVNAAMGISYKHSAPQCSVQRAQFKEPTRILTKQEVVVKRLTELLLCSQDVICPS